MTLPPALVFRCVFRRSFPSPKLPRAVQGLLVALLLGGLAFGGLAGCGGDETTVASGPTPPISLLEHWSEVRVEGLVEVPESSARSVLSFDGEPGSEGDDGLAPTWKALVGVEDLRVENGRLVGRTTSASAAILLEVPSPLGVDDELWAVEMTVRASAGQRTGVHPVRQPGLSIPELVERLNEWPFASPLVAGPLDDGESIPTYRVEADDVFLLEMITGLSKVRQVLVHPTNAAGADFEIESVRLVFRQEHLASIASGPGWHGLGEVFRETLVARAPETLSFDVTLPERPWLHLAVGSVAPVPPGFEVSIVELGEGAPGEPVTVAEPRVEAPEVWESMRVDLGAWAGQRVELRLRAVPASDAADPLESLAFWGAPTIRSALPTGPDETAEGSQLAERPQLVILFLCDTLRSDHLDAWGYERPTAPTLARLASEGIRFQDVLAQATWTKASVSSILTSLHPSTTGIKSINDRLSAGETTLAEAFRAAGYATFATSSVPFTGQLTRLHQGVEVLYEAGAIESDGEGYQSKTAAFWVDTFLEWAEQHRDVPAFGFIHVMDPHSPFRPPEPYDTLWGSADGAERFEEQSARVAPLIESPLLRRFMAPTAKELAAAGVDAESFVAQEKAWYDGSIRGVDDNLARLLARLEEWGLDDETLFAFVADHGEGFLEHGLHWHGNSVYGELTNVPMVLWGSALERHGIVPGQTVETPVQTLDLMPTLLELSSIDIPERAQGRSLVPLLVGKDPGRTPPAFSEHHRSAAEGESSYDSYAMVKGEWKLIWHVNPPEGMPEYELFHHATDPLDLEDVAEGHPGLVAEMGEELARWREWAEGARLDEAEVQSALGAEELERLRSLGYVE